MKGEPSKWPFPLRKISSASHRLFIAGAAGKANGGHKHQRQKRRARCFLRPFPTDWQSSSALCVERGLAVTGDGRLGGSCGVTFFQSRLLLTATSRSAGAHARCFPAKRPTVTHGTTGCKKLSFRKQSFRLYVPQQRSVPSRQASRRPSPHHG